MTDNEIQLATSVHDDVKSWFFDDYLPTWAGVAAGTIARGPEYLMGNHTIAERMFRHEPSVMLHAPLRTLLYADSDGDTKLAVDQPSLLFSSYDNPEIADVGCELDGLLAQLIELLGAQPPAELRARVP